MYVPSINNPCFARERRTLVLLGDFRNPILPWLPLDVFRTKDTITIVASSPWKLSTVLNVTIIYNIINNHCTQNHPMFANDRSY